MIDNNRVAIIDYELCNLFSVVNACRYVGLEPVITSDHNEIMSCGGAILPGVGAFGEAMAQIRQKKLDKTIYEFVKSKKPFMGVCLGLHLLFDRSEEFGDFDQHPVVGARREELEELRGEGEVVLRIPLR